MNSWILAPYFDLIFFSSFWILIPFAIIVYLFGSVIGDLSFLIFIYGPLIRLPHFFATFVMIKNHADQIGVSKKNYILWFFIPIVLFLSFTFPVFILEGKNNWKWMLLFKLSLILATIHLNMQNYMILQIYKQKTANPLVKTEQLFEKLIFLLLIVQELLLMLGEMFLWLKLFPIT